MISLISPIVVFSAVWIIQALAYLVLPINLLPPSQEAWLIVTTGILSLFAGSLVFKVIDGYITQTRTSTFSKTSQSTLVSRKLLYSSIALSMAVAVYLGMTIDKNEVGFIHSLKESLLAEAVAESKSITYLIYFFIYQVLLTLYYFNCNGLKKDGRTALICSAAVISAIMSGSRGLLVFFIIALIPCIASQQEKLNLNARLLLKLTISVVILFFLYPFIFQGMATESSFEWLVLIDYVSIYLFSGIAAFSDYLKTDIPRYDCLLAAPKPLLLLLNKLFGINLALACPPYYDEKLLPLPTNVYSIFFAPHHDFGMMGVVAYLFIIGFITQMFFTRGCLHDNCIWRFFYCIFFYSLVFSFFEEQFSRGAIYYFFGGVAVFSNRLIRRLDT